MQIFVPIKIFYNTMLHQSMDVGVSTYEKLG
jgi:hypothetical protein